MSGRRVHFSTIEEFASKAGMPKPEHPMLLVWSEKHYESELATADEPITYSNDFYMIAIKNIVSGELHYGRTKYDFSNGSMMFAGPRQEITFSEKIVSRDCLMIFIHEDFLRGHDIRSAFKNAGFFSYAVNEALHLSPREEKLMRALMMNIHAEYQSNQDEFSKELLLSQLDTLLKYANRFYKRQFLNREHLSDEIADRFEHALRLHFEGDNGEMAGMPSVERIARDMNMSARYLSDSLKSRTGMSAMDHIHQHLLDEAKHLLLAPDLTIAQVAHRLGFDYPQYFSRLFKKKIGMSPKMFRQTNTRH